jgi:hypothetical protein
MRVGGARSTLRGRMRASCLGCTRMRSSAVTQLSICSPNETAPPGLPGGADERAGGHDHEQVRVPVGERDYGCSAKCRTRASERPRWSRAVHWMVAVSVAPAVLLYTTSQLLGLLYTRLEPGSASVSRRRPSLIQSYTSTSASGSDALQITTAESVGPSELGKTVSDAMVGGRLAGAVGSWPQAGAPHSIVASVATIVEWRRRMRPSVVVVRLLQCTTT